MTQTRMRIAAYDFASADGLRLETGGYYFLFANAGNIDIIDETGSQVLAEGEGRFLASGVTVRGGGWLFTLTPADGPGLPASIAGMELASTITLDADQSYIFRADAVTSQPGAQTPRHGHRGPGIRRLLTGLLLAEVGDGTKRIRAGDAWFESGEEWVVGSNISEGANTFIRVMVLPAELKGGQSSFVAASPEEAAKPRAAQYHLFGEVDVLLEQRGNN